MICIYIKLGINFLSHFIIYIIFRVTFFHFFFIFFYFLLELSVYFYYFSQFFTFFSVFLGVYVPLRGPRPTCSLLYFLKSSSIPFPFFYSLPYLLFFYYFTHYEFISFKKLGNNTNSTFLQDNYKQILRNLNIKSNTLGNFKSTLILENEN